MTYNIQNIYVLNNSQNNINIKTYAKGRLPMLSLERCIQLDVKYPYPFDNVVGNFVLKGCARYTLPCNAHW